MLKRCIIYLRVSTAEQAGPGHHSLEAQEILCRRYAEGNKLEVVEALRDEGYSGRTNNRPGLRRLLEYTGSHPPVKIDTLLVQDTSRMGRDTTEYLLFRRQLRERGIELVAVTQPNIDSSPEGTLVDTIMAGINQYQSEEKGRRVSIALQKKFEEGWWPGWAPLGYRHVEKEGKRYIEPDPSTFHLLQQAFREYATGNYAQEQLCRRLAKQGLRNRSGNLITRTSMNDLLANPFFWGLMRWHGEERIGNHAPAVDRATWERCQRVTALHNQYVSRQRKHVFLLAGLSRCDACGNFHTHSVVARKGKNYYHCKSRANCQQPYIPQEDLEVQVEDLVKRTRLTRPFIDRVVNKVREVFVRRHELDRKRVQVLTRRQAVLEQQRNSAEEKLLSGVLSDDAYRRHLPRIAQELDDIRRELDDLESARRLDTDALREILLFARDIPHAYNQAPQPLKKQYLTFFFKEFVVRDKQIIRTDYTDLFQILQDSAGLDGKFEPKAQGSRGCTLFEPIIGLLKSTSWLAEQRKLMAAASAASQQSSAGRAA